jgi:predicted nucleic acid-binding protein
VSAILTIDTNIWAYYFDGDCPEHRSVIRPVERALKSEQISVNTIIVMELAHFLVKSLGSQIGADKLDQFLRFPLMIVDFDYQNSLSAIEMLKKYSHLGLGGRDATLLAMMDGAGEKRIMTHDEALKRVDWLEPIDPVKPS